MDYDDGFNTSEAEWDSEIDESEALDNDDIGDVEDLTLWLNQQAAACISQTVRLHYYCY